MKARIASAKHTCFVVFGALLLTSLSCGQSPSSDSASNVEELRKQVLQLKEENQQLKEENQRLRALLTEAGPSQNKSSQAAEKEFRPQTGAPSRNAVPSYAAPVQKSGGRQLTPTHWLTFPSNERHNRNCFWYHTGQGRPCQANEGIPCKICGG
jgi:hypothetical protein